MAGPKKLTDKQERFCREYIIDLNATQAAIRAKYSENTADVIGYENLGKPYMQARIAELQQAAAEKVAISAENVLKSIMDIRDSATAKLAMTSKTTGEKIGETMVDYNAGLRANELLGKHLALFTDKIEMNLTAKLEDFID